MLVVKSTEQCLEIFIIVNVGADAKRNPVVIALNVTAADILSDLVAV